MRDLFEQMLASKLRVLEQVLGDLLDRHVLAEVVLVDDGLHGDQVDDALEVGLSPDGELDRHRVSTQAIDHRLHAAIEIGADAVHLVDVGDARHVVLVGLAPDRLRLGLDARRQVEQTPTAPSRTRSERSTSAVKSTWPGVSMRLMRCRPTRTGRRPTLIVIPRSCSCSIAVRSAVPSCTSPILCDLPV